jgi:hypothetical protein
MILASLLAAGALSAQDKKGCNNATVKGSFGYVVSGTRPSSTNGPIEPFVGSLIRTYDGEGNFTQVDYIHGALSGWVADRPGKGTYSIKEDCTGIVKLQIPGVPFEPEERFTVVDDGNQIISATVVPATVLATNLARRISTDQPQKHADAAVVGQDTYKLLRTLAQRLGLFVDPAK